MNKCSDKENLKQPLEPNNPEQEARVLENLVEWLRDSETKNSVKLGQARLVLEGVSRRLRGIDTRGWMGYE